MASPHSNGQAAWIAKSDGGFATTHWSVVLAAGANTTQTSQAALESLCQTYWYPLYAYVRRRGHSPEDAQDLTQAFFVHLLEKQSVGRADRDRGRFRSFLLSSLKHFLVNEHKKAQTVKRGGRRASFSLDVEDAEERFQGELVDDLTPEKFYEKRWATMVLERVFQVLQEEYRKAGNPVLFSHLKARLWGEEAKPYAEMAAVLGMSEGAVKIASHRLRHRFREILRSEIAHTVASPEEIEEEIGNLMRAFG